MGESRGKLLVYIYAAVIAGMLGLCLALYWIGVRPLAARLEEIYNWEIHDSLQDTKRAFDALLEEQRQAVARLSGRSAIVARQIAFLEGEIDLAALMAFSVPQLADSMGPQSAIRGLARHAPDGTFLFAVGEPVSGGLAPRCAAGPAGVSLLALRNDGSGSDFFYCSPLGHAGFGRVGFDIVRMDGREMDRLIAAESDALMTFVLLRGRNIVFAPRSAEARAAVEALRGSLNALEREEEGETNADPAFAVLGITGLPGGLELRAVVDRERYFAPVAAIRDRLLLSIPLAFTAAILLTMLTVRPLVRALETKSRQAHDRKLYREMFLGSQAVMLLIDPADGGIVDANPAAAHFYGYDRDALLAMTIQEINIMSPAEVAAERRRAQRRVTNTFLFRHRIASGDIRAVEVHSTPLNWDGRALLFSVIHDMTERKRMEDALVETRQQAEAANQAKSEFIAAMSHELRSPLNVILGFSEVIENEMFGPVGTPRYREYAADIHKSGSHLIDLIDDLLDLAKIEAGRVPIAPEPVDLAALVEDCLKLVRQRARDHGLALDQHLADDLPLLQADPRALRQILFNLLSNAIKFTPKGGRVTVSAAGRAEGGIMLSVADTGIGMSLADREHLFEPFYRTPDAERRHIEGTGLGLALVKSMMEQHGGRVTLESEPGRGTVFHLIFPVRSDGVDPRPDPGTCPET